MSDRRPVAARILSMLDLTNLDDECSEEQVEKLCARAVSPFGAVAAVCVWPRFVALAKNRLEGTSVRVATVANFPDGATDVDEVITLILTALADGADEIDVVAPYRALISGDETAYCDFLRAVRVVVREPAHLKVILETGELPDPQTVERAATLAIECGADFIKTSTGKTKESATIDAAAVMLRVISRSGRKVGLKPSGGIRTVPDAAKYLELADAIMGPSFTTQRTMRFGASGLLDAVEHELA